MRDRLTTLLDDFRSYGREVAVVRYQGNRRRVTTYGELARLAGRFAAFLEARGIRQGDRVVLWAENSAEWIAAFHGCMLGGVLAVPLDASGTADFAARVALDVKPKLAVGDAVLLSHLPETFAYRRKTAVAVARIEESGTGTAVLAPPAVEEAEEIAHLDFEKLAFEDWLTSLPIQEAGAVEGLTHETPLQILFTSGTTGDPKGIVLTHGNVLASVGPIEAASQPYLKYERLIHPLRILHTLPLSHVFGQTMGLWVPHIYKAELYFESRLVAPRLVDTIRKERISVLAAVPRVLALLKTHLEATLPGLADRALGPGGSAKGVPLWKRWWRFRDVHRAFGIKFWALISGGGALPGPLENFWNAVGLVLVQGYGMTETTAIITLNHPFHVAQGTIGKPLPGREVKLAPDGEVLVRGASISSATWSGGQLHERTGEWLATGDLAETEASGELRFLGRKSEVIVTANGLNLHPEDLEAEIEREPGVAGCAVVPLETPSGVEPCAVLAFRGTAEQAATAIEHANTRLAEFQQLRRWEVWPEPDLPRTSTGKVRRKAVTQWLQERHESAAQAGTAIPRGQQTAANGDWLLKLIGQITGEAPPGSNDSLRLSEDLQLDSLGRVQLAAAIEERLGTLPESGDGSFDQVRTLGDLRSLLGSVNDGAAARATPFDAKGKGPFLAPANSLVTSNHRTSSIDGHGNAGISSEGPTPPTVTAPAPDDAAAHLPEQPVVKERSNYLFPRWQWWLPVRWLRALFVEAVMRPLVWLLTKPSVLAKGPIAAKEPMLIIANHITSFDGPLLEYALPGFIRRRMAVAMSGDMLEDFRHFRHPERPGKFFLPGPLYYVMVTAFFNVFPLSGRRDFQRSFAHAGDALDHGYNVLVFPEGARSESGQMARFRPGIGLLVKQSGTAVLPMAMRGLGELKPLKRGWIRSGTVELRIGEPIRFSPTETETSITARLQSEVEKLLND